MNNLTHSSRFTNNESPLDANPVGTADPLSGVRRAINAIYGHAVASGNRALKHTALCLLVDVGNRRRQFGLAGC